MSTKKKTTSTDTTKPAAPATTSAETSNGTMSLEAQREAAAEIVRQTALL